MAEKTLKRWLDTIAEIVDFNFYYLVLVNIKELY